MAKQKCGTCRFYQEAGLAGSGWCLHPQRKVSSDVMLLVRHSELACRNDWANSLWEPLQGGEPAEAPFQRPASLGPTTPATLDNMRSLLQADTTIAAETLHGEDVLLSEGRIISEAHEPPPQPVRPTTGGGFDPRTAVMKAREAYRERARARDAAARQSAGAAAIVEPEMPKAQDSTEPLSEAIEATAAASAYALESRPGASKQVRTDLATEEVVASEAWPQNGINGWPYAETSGTARGRDSNWDRVLGEEAETLDEQQASSELSGKDTSSDTTLPAWYRTDLPRVCRTCRDFRPSTEGGRGWCANAWAFTHRRLVQEDDVAPCESSFGDWWAPVDDVWLVAADVSSHSRATPLLDRLTEQERGQRRRS